MPRAWRSWRLTRLSVLPDAGRTVSLFGRDVATLERLHY